MVFTVPDSTPPSTPDKSRSLFSNPSTTPAGPPPSSSGSFTPHGITNSSIFGQSQMRSTSNVNFSESTFSQSGNFGGGNDNLFSSFSSSKLPPLQNGKGSIFSGSFNNPSAFKPVNSGNNLKVRNRKPHGLSQMSAASEDWEDEEDAEGEEEEEEEEEIEEEEEEYVEEEDYEEEGEEEYEDEEEIEEDDENQEDQDSEGDMEMDATGNVTGPEFGNSIFSKSFVQSTAPAPAQKRIYSNPNNAKRAKLDEQWATSSPTTGKDIPSPRKKSSQFSSVARDLVSRAKTAAVIEPGEVVLSTNEYVGELLDGLQDSNLRDADAVALVSDTTSALTDLWGAACKKQREQSGRYRPHDDFGPGEHATGLERATVVASLLLRLHHPPLKDSTERDTISSFGHKPVQSLVLSSSSVKTFVPIPKVLVDWLNENHLGSMHEIEALRQHSPNPTASQDFWEIVQAGVLRGRFGDMAALLRSADFNYARSALQDGFSQPGYRGMQLQSVQKVVNKAIQILETSPINRDDDWQINGFEWTSYRKRVHSALSELQEFAEGDNAHQRPGGAGFEASRFGVSQGFAPAQSGFSFTQSLRMAESRIPWSIYQGINTIYGILLGETSAIMSVAQDWIESTVGLTTWWDGQENSKIGNKGSHSLHTSGAEEIDIYLQRLEDSFGAVTDNTESKSRPNPLDPLDVGVACVFEGNVVGAVKLLQTWSLCIAASVAEIAHEGGWLDASPVNPTLPGFLNQNDLMVLSYGQNDRSVTDQISKDDILDAYSSGLGYRDQFQYNGVTRKGWQLALEILSRMEDTSRTKERVSALLDRIPVDKIEQVEQVIILCSDLGFEEEGRKIASNFGEQIIAAGRSHEDCDYGLAMVCFARARSIRDVKEIANSLIAYSLHQSRAWPPDEQLSGQLRSLVKNPRIFLSSIAKFDPEAAQILQFYVSGYATLRRFYDLRDELVLSKDGAQQPQLRPLARKRAAAEALVAVIRSSADCICGGLYDIERDSAVLVDNLLALLGEAIVFVSQTPSTLTIEQQSSILAAIEDLETVTPRVFAVAQEFFYECLNEYIYEKTGETRKPPSKSASGLTASSSFSMIDSHMADSSITNKTNATTTSSTSASGSGLVPKPDPTRIYATPIQRGWDWRGGLAESSGAANEEEARPELMLLRVLRLRLARGMVWR